MKRIMLVFVCLIFILGCLYTAPGVKAAENAVPSINTGFQHSGSKSSSGSLEDTASPSDTSEPSDKAKILAVGDIMCLYAQLGAAKSSGSYNFDYCYDMVRDKISGADLAVGNFETLVAPGYPYTQNNQNGNPKMNAPLSFLNAAAGGGFDVLTNANNHILDRKADGINKTIANINKYNLKHTGAYAAGETRSQLIVNVKGINVAILAYTDIINNSGKAAMVDRYSAAKLNADIDAVKKAGADFIIVSMHWGTERTHKVTSTQKKQAAYIAKAGADIIIGSHPHCVQGSASIATDHGSVPVFYSLGNFVSSMGATMCKDSMMVNISIEKDTGTGKTSIAKLTYTATYCTGSGGKNYVILPADLDSIANSSKAQILKNSRARTINIVGTNVASPE